MRRSSRIPFLIVLCLLCLSEAPLFGQLLRQPSAIPAHSKHKQDGFFDYILGKVNSGGNDYGASVQAGRDAIVASSIDDLYFWSNVLTLFLMTGASAVIFLQWRSTDKKEVIAASLIAELWNGRVSDRIELERRTEQFNQLVEIHNAGVEKALSLRSEPAQPERNAAGDLGKGVRKLTDKVAERAKTGSASAATPDGNLASLQQSNLLLQRRVEALQNNEQNLKQRLNQTTLLLDEERRRNGALKGA